MLFDQRSAFWWLVALCAAHAAAQSSVYPQCGQLLTQCDDPWNECLSERPYCNCTRKISCYYGRCTGSPTQLFDQRAVFERECRSVYNCSTCDAHLRLYEKVEPPGYLAIILSVLSVVVLAAAFRSLVTLAASVAAEPPSRVARRNMAWNPRAQLPMPVVVLHRHMDEQRDLIVNNQNQNAAGAVVVNNNDDNDPARLENIVIVNRDDNDSNSNSSLEESTNSDSNR